MLADKGCCGSADAGCAVKRTPFTRAAGAGCVEALAEERAVLLALWVVHRPPSATCRLLALRLLHALAPAPAAAWAAAAHAGALYLLAALLPPPAAASAAERARARRPHRLRPAAGRPCLGPRAAALVLPPCSGPSSSPCAMRWAGRLQGSTTAAAARSGLRPGEAPAEA